MLPPEEGHNPSLRFFQVLPSGSVWSIDCRGTGAEVEKPERRLLHQSKREMATWSRAEDVEVVRSS